MAFDKLPGLVLALDGRTVGEGWYAPENRERTAAGIRAECHDRHGPWDSRIPLVIFNRPVSAIEIATLRSCGLDFATDYRLLAPAAETGGYSIYVPTSEAVDTR